MSQVKLSYLAYLIRIILSILLFGIAFYSIKDIHSFINNLNDYDLLAKFDTNYVAYIIVALEIIFGLMLFFNYYSATILRILLGGSFILAAYLKFNDMPFFTATIDAFSFTPAQMTLFIAYTIIALEIIFGSLLIFNLKFGLGGITLLILFFLAVLGYGLAIDLKINCSCFGPPINPWDTQNLPDNPLWSAIYRDFIMLVIIIYLWIDKEVNIYKRGLCSFK